LLSVADDEPPAAPAIIADVQPERMLSPEALAPHPGAIETDPFFSTEDQVARDESIDEANTAAAKTLPFSTSPTVSDGLTSAHSMQPTRRSSSAERARTSSATALLSRRFSNLSATGRKPPTRTESGREFWGLPETKQPTSLSDQDEESEEEDEEWVSRGLVVLTFRESCPTCAAEALLDLLRPVSGPSLAASRPAPARS
jgi:hypothetical protein